MPARLRPHVAAIYAFARIADDYADEPGRSDDERIRLLDDWRAKLHDTAPHKGVPSQVGRRRMSFSALHDTIQRFELPVALFDDLLSAFKQDVTTTRYESWADVLDYCRRSANPVGRLVLRLSGYRDAASRSRLRRGVHGAATDELLAGPGDRLVARPAVRARRNVAAPRRRPGVARWRPHDAGVDGRPARLRPAHARAVQRGPAGVRRRVGPLALRAARDLAWRHAAFSIASTSRRSTSSPPARNSASPTQ